MGGCISAPRDGSGVLGDPSDTSGVGVSIGKNQPLKPDRPRWKSEVPLTEGQLRNKREEFWDTAPAFEGRKEIWDALKAAAYAMETMDHAMAQAIVDGASISLPHGTLMDCYDELGNRYQLPVYVLAPPSNLIQEPSDTDTNSESESPTFSGTESLVKFRLSTGVDVKLTVRSTDSILKIKKRLFNEQGIEPCRQRWFFAGKPLHNKMIIEDAKIPRGYVVQVVVAPEPKLPS